MKKNLNTKSSQKVQVTILNCHHSANVSPMQNCKYKKINLLNNNGIYRQTKVKQHVYTIIWESHTKIKVWNNSGVMIQLTENHSSKTKCLQSNEWPDKEVAQ